MLEFYADITDTYGYNVTSIMKELLNNLPIEYNDLFFFCKMLNICKKYEYERPYLFFNQHIVYNEIIKKFNLRFL